MNNGWEPFFKETSNKDYSKRLKVFLDKEYSSSTVYPPRHLMFNAFKLTSPQTVKVVIIGQDPYHEPGQAMGLCFSVPKGVKFPPSLVNIYKELENDVGAKMDYCSGDLTYLAKQGVLLLNAYLSVREGEPLSHAIPEYKDFIKDVFTYLESLDRPIVYLLWGGFAKKYASLVTNPKHVTILSNHPSPLSANRGGWFGTKPFSKCNKYLIDNGLTPIDWENK